MKSLSHLEKLLALLKHVLKPVALLASVASILPKLDSLLANLHEWLSIRRQTLVLSESDIAPYFVKLCYVSVYFPSVCFLDFASIAKLLFVKLEFAVLIAAPLVNPSQDLHSLLVNQQIDEVFV